MSFGLTIDTSRFVTRAKNYVDNLNTYVKSEWPLIAAEMAADVLSRTPSKDTEYEYLMTGASKAASLIPRAGDRSGDTDPAYATGHSKDRIRFIRNPGEWLEDLVTKAGTSYNFSPGTLSINLGIISNLEALSKFSWQNVSKPLGAATPTIYHKTSAYGTWSFFEYGGGFHVYPQTSTPRQYRLTPDYYTRVSEMYKDYPAFRMYSGFSKHTFIEAVATRIRNVKY